MPFVKPFLNVFKMYPEVFFMEFAVPVGELEEILGEYLLGVDETVGVTQIHVPCADYPFGVGWTSYLNKTIEHILVSVPESCQGTFLYRQAVVIFMPEIPAMDAVG